MPAARGSPRVIAQCRPSKELGDSNIGIGYVFARNHRTKVPLTIMKADCVFAFRAEDHLGLIYAVLAFWWWDDSPRYGQRAKLRREAREVRLGIFGRRATKHEGARKRPSILMQPAA